jgi:dolichol-phosphate mannosyltransferase
MSLNKELSIVIPCFNEGASVARFERELLPELSALGRSYEVLLVDDGSIDGSAQGMAELSRQHPEIKVLTHQHNRGLGCALRTAFAAASGDWIAVLDADLTFHPRQLNSMLEKRRETGADLVSGSPYLTAPGLKDVPWIRKLPSLALNAFYRGLFDTGFSSYTPIFRLYSAALLKNLVLESDGFEINAEIAVRAWLARRRLAEIPAVLETRREGSSKLNRWRELKSHARLILKLLRETQKAS